MREGWEYKKLNEVCDKSSSNIVINKLDDNNGDYPLFGASGLVRNVDFYHQDKPYIGIVKDGAGVGRVNTYPAYSSLVGTMQYIFPKEECLLNYVKYFLIKLDLSHCVSGATIPHIYFKDYGKELIPIPPLSTQLSIVSELDKINELIRLKKEQLKDYDNLAQSIFCKMFGDPVVNEKGWEVKKLGELSDLICNGNTPKGGSEVYVDTGFLFLRSQNVWKNRIELDDVAFIDEATHKSLKKSSLKHNDLLITKTGRINTENSSLGRTALFEGEDNSANINGHVYLVRLKDGMVHKFVLYILISNSYKELIRKTCVGGIDKRQLNKDHIEDFPIIFPPIELQKKYVERIELIEKQKEQVRSTIQDLETLLASRMQYWFD